MTCRIFILLLLCLIYWLIAHYLFIYFLLLLSCDRAFGYSSEDVQMVIESMAAQGKEPTFCMGDDIPLAILSQRPHMLYDYFKQRFAQVYYKFLFLFFPNNLAF